MDLLRPIVGMGEFFLGGRGGGRLFSEGHKCGILTSFLLIQKSLYSQPIPIVIVHQQWMILVSSSVLE